MGEKKMKYRFLGKPDKKFPDLITGKVYELEVVVMRWGLMDIFTLGSSHPQIIKPFSCPYSNWESFYKNWEVIKENKNGR